jgi:hypothetical protein
MKSFNSSSVCGVGSDRRGFQEHLNLPATLPGERKAFAATSVTIQGFSFMLETCHE